MYDRSVKYPQYSFFLFGPRGTGKTTDLRKKLPNALWKNLLLDKDFLPLLADNSLLANQVKSLPKNSWVVIDEVQRIPTLLNEIHNIISENGDDYYFAISGSSARKLKRLNSNLLAGRAIEKKMFPLTSLELGDDFNLNEALSYGTLPVVINRKELAVDILNTYVGTYIKQEIQQEALVENIGAFHRFLSVASLMNGEIINISNIARDCSVARSTVQRYFDILVDTLIAYRLPGWQPKLKVKERLTPKFYLFDTGVVRTFSQRIRSSLSDLEVGKLLETFILHEIRAAQEYLNVGGELFYWQSSGNSEIDFIWQRGEKIVAIEVKASKVWRNQYTKTLQKLKESKPSSDCYCIYRGVDNLKFKDINVLTIEDFLQKLHSGNILC